MARYDSLSRFDRSADHFNVYTTNKLKDPEEVLRLSALTTRDTLEVSPSKIEKEVTQAFRANNHQLPNERMAVIAKVGRFVFTVVTVPPYLVLYAIPRWLAAQVLPGTFQLLMTAIKRTFRPFEQITLALYQQLRKIQALWKALQVKVSSICQKFFKLFAMLKNPWNGLVDAFRGILKKGAQLKKSLLFMFNPLVRFRAVLSNWKQLFLAPWKRLGNYLRALPGRCMARLRAAIIKKLEPYIRAFRICQRLFCVLTLPIQGAIQRVHNLYLTFKKSVVQFTNFLKKELVSFSSKVQAFLLPLFRPFATAWRLGCEKVGLSLTRLKSAFRWKFPKIRLPSLSLNLSHARAIRTLAYRLGAALMARLNGLREGAAITKKAMKEALFRARLKIGSLVQHWFSRKKEQQGKLKKKKGSFLLKCRTYAEHTKQRVRLAIYWGLLIQAWVRVLCKFWMFTVHRFTYTFFEHLTWRDIKYLVGQAISLNRRQNEKVKPVPLPKES